VLRAAESLPTYTYMQNLPCTPTVMYGYGYGPHVTCYTYTWVWLPGNSNSEKICHILGLGG